MTNKLLVLLSVILTVLFIVDDRKVEQHSHPTSYVSEHVSIGGENTNDISLESAIQLLYPALLQIIHPLLETKHFLRSQDVKLAVAFSSFIKKAEQPEIPFRNPFIYSIPSMGNAEDPSDHIAA